MFPSVLREAGELRQGIRREELLKKKKQRYSFVTRAGTQAGGLVPETKKQGRHSLGGSGRGGSRPAPAQQDSCA